jgi:alpha-mannosidase
MLNDVVILIPCHSLEDFPTDLGDKPAESILNAFAVAWHPWLLAQTRSLPGWHRADSPPEPAPNRLILVPLPSQDHLESDWIKRQRDAGAFVVSGLHKRDELLAEVLATARDWTPPQPATAGATPFVGDTPSGTDPAISPTTPEQLDAELVADFLALGTTHLLVELLSRQMHYFGEIDEMRLRREAIEAAEALVAGRLDDVPQRLSACFETLHEARERFYPTDAFLLDMCLLIPSLADDKLVPLLTGSKPVSFLMTARDAEQLASEKPDLAKLLREAVLRETAEILGGDWSESPSPILPLESALYDLRRGRAALQQLFRKEPTTWARRRFGLSPMLPQLLTKSGYTAACHFLLDDGIYPDAENSKLRWEGCDNSTIDAISRLPLAADSATSYLRLPQRMAEAMQQDQAAGLIVARWPDVRSPFFGDLLRGAKFSPVIGRFVTFREFFERTDAPMRHTRHEAGEYLAPFLTRSVAAREADPITRFRDHFERRQRFDSALWLRCIAATLRGRRLHEVDASATEHLVEEAGPDLRENASSPESSLANLEQSGERELSQTILHGTTDKTPGVLVVNPLSFTRRVPVAWPSHLALPALGGAVKGVFDDDTVREALLEIPGCGFVWLSTSNSGKSPRVAADELKTPLVEDNVLRNEFFEVHISPDTGGIQRVKEYGRKPNRISQQLAFRFPRERSITVSDDDREFEEKSYYSESRCLGVEVASRGPWLGEIRTRGEIVDQKTNGVLATFQQTFRLWRGRRVLDIDIAFDNVKMPDGEPWTNYFGVRWAWMDTTAALTRSVLGTAQPLGQERFESPHYLEIADSDTRTTIIHHGLPFHRKTGRRMCDSLLIVEGETRRRFRFSVAVERPYPQQAALDAMCPAVIIPTEVGPPRCGATGWFLHVDAPNVQLTRLTDLMDEPRSDAATWESPELATVATGSGFAVRLQETEGRQQSVAVSCFRTPLSVRQRDFTGRTIGHPRIDGDAIRLTLSPFEITDLELRFDPPPAPSPSASTSD